MARIKSKTTAHPAATRLGYFDDVQRPVTSLVFLLPMVAVYEVGMYLLAGSLSETLARRVIAFQLLRQFFALFGASSFYLPGLAIVAILSAWQLATGKRWTIHWRTTLIMGLESFMLAIPLVVMSYISATYAHSPHLAAAGEVQAAAGKLLLSIGAGLYLPAL